MICLNLRILTVVYNITHRQIKLFLTITKETCILVHSSKNNAQLVSGQDPGTTTGLTRLLCLNSQFLQPFVPLHPPLHMCPTPGPLAKWQAHAPVIERCWQGARAGYSCVQVRAAGVHISAVMEDQQIAPECSLLSDQR